LSTEEHIETHEYVCVCFCNRKIWEYRIPDNALLRKLSWSNWERA